MDYYTAMGKERVIYSDMEQCPKYVEWELLRCEQSVWCYYSEEPKLYICLKSHIGIAAWQPRVWGWEGDILYDISL